MSIAHTDKEAVEQLRATFSRNSTLINNAQGSIDNYLREMQDSMNRDLQVISKRLEEAEKKLITAEAALRCCESKQKWDDENHEYRPSCSFEASRVRGARCEYQKYKQIYDSAKRIIDECNSRISGYNHTVRNILTGLCTTSNDACTRLGMILNRIDEYQNNPSSLSTSITTAYSIKGTNLPKKLKQQELEEKSQEYAKKVASLNKVRKFTEATKEINKRQNKNICPICGRIRPCNCANGSPREELSRTTADAYFLSINAQGRER